MSGQIKEINEIILHKKDGLVEEFLKELAEVAGIESTEDFKQEILKDSKIALPDEAYEAIKKVLLAVDETAVKLTPYDEGILSDINRGHWDIYRRSDESDSSITFQLPEGKVFQARSPLLDIRSGTVAIDFGTKSTVAGFINEKSTKQLIRIGKGNRGLEDKNDYENPTTMEFINIEHFIQQYNFCKTRPFTSFDDICVSHQAQNNLESADNEDFYRFFRNLKQWAGSSNNIFRIKDKNKAMELKDFAKCGEKDLNPIELYAYYIGRYINNMTGGIYLEYLISYPVKYSPEVREKLRESFERGIRKSIPFAVFCDSECANRFKVEMVASEPAAYAVSALSEYGFRKKEVLEKPMHYGIFDFGWGTTDFDFGIWRVSKKLPRYAFDIEHFGEGGDPLLGGENLLELLAQEVVEANKESLINGGYTFIKSPLKEVSGGTESLFVPSQDSRQNTAKLIEKLRVVWECTHLFKEECDFSGIDEDIVKDIKGLQDGIIEVQLNNNARSNETITLKVEVSKLIEVLKDRIHKGVDMFYHSFKLVADRMEDLKKLHIFLGGNSSRSILVKEAFEARIEKAKDEGDPTEFERYPPLGTQEAEAKLQELGIEVKEVELSKKVTCKTGVVFGLLDSRKTSKIQVVAEKDEKFHYFIGYDDGEGKFFMQIDKNKVSIANKNPMQFLPYADITEFDIYYTKDVRATTNELSLEDVIHKKLMLDQSYGEEDCICIWATGLDTIKYGVYRGDKLIKEFDEVQLKS